MSNVSRKFLDWCVTFVLLSENKMRFREHSETFQLMKHQMSCTGQSTLELVLTLWTIFLKTYFSSVFWLISKHHCLDKISDSLSVVDINFCYQCHMIWAMMWLSHKISDINFYVEDIPNSTVMDFESLSQFIVSSKLIWSALPNNLMTYHIKLDLIFWDCPSRIYGILPGPQASNIEVTKDTKDMWHVVVQFEFLLILLLYHIIYILVLYHIIMKNHYICKR